MYSHLATAVDPFHFAVTLGNIALAAAPLVIVAGYEIQGCRHEAVALARALEPDFRR